MSVLEHDPEKWKPVFRKDHAQLKDQITAMIRHGQVRRKQTSVRF
jgi:hypothetical protein